MRTVIRILGAVISVLLVVGCQPEVGPDVSYGSPVTQELVTETVDITPNWAKSRPFLFQALSLIGKPGNEVKSLLGEPISGGTRGAMPISSDYHDSLLYTWDVEDDSVCEVAIGRTSKLVEAVYIEVHWGNIQGTDAPSMEEMLEHLGFDSKTVKLLADRDAFWTFVTSVNRKDGLMTKVRGMCREYTQVVRREHDLESGSQKRFLSRDPKFSLGKTWVADIYIGPADISPFDAFGSKPLIIGDAVPAIGEEILQSN